MRHPLSSSLHDSPEIRKNKKHLSTTTKHINLPWAINIPGVSGNVILPPDKTTNPHLELQHKNCTLHPKHWRIGAMAMTQFNFRFFQNLKRITLSAYLIRLCIRQGKRNWNFARCSMILCENFQRVKFKIISKQEENHEL